MLSSAFPDRVTVGPVMTLLMASSGYTTATIPRATTVPRTAVYSARSCPQLGDAVDVRDGQHGCSQRELAGDVHHVAVVAGQQPGQ